MAGYRPMGRPMGGGMMPPTGGGTGPTPPSGFNPRDAMVHELYARSLRQPPAGTPGVVGAMANINNPPPGSAIPPPPPGIPQVPGQPPGMMPPDATAAGGGPMMPGQLPPSMQPTNAFPQMLQQPQAPTGQPPRPMPPGGGVY